MKKLIAIVLTLALIVACVVPMALAADAKIVVSSANAKAGEEVVVKITLQDNPGITSAKLNVAYDSSIMTIKSVSVGSAYSGAMTQSQTLSANPYILNYCDGLLTVDNTAEDFATITFVVAEDAATTAAKVTVTYDQADVYNFDEDDVVFEVENATISVEGASTPCTHANTELKNFVAATCTTDGYAGDTYCTDCGEKVAQGTTIDALGHNYQVTSAAVAATCTAEGKTAVETCSRCGDVKGGETIAKEAHIAETTEEVTKEATCTEAGSKTVTTKFTVCGYINETKTEEIAATGHDLQTTEKVTKEATCAAEGEKEVTESCTKCDYTKTTTESIAKLDHTWGDVENAKEATETEEGYTGDKTCTVCGEVQKGETIPVKTPATEDEGKDDTKTEDKKDDTKAGETTTTTTEASKTTPSTGDNSTMIIVICLGLLAVSGTAVVVLKKKVNE